MRRRLLVLSLAAAACGAPATPARSPAASVAAKTIAAPAGVTLVAACTPTGPELCFNAVDDNCNGVVDEGCGLGTGVLQFVIAWGDSPADVDLVVTDPSGTRVFDANKQTPSGLRLDRDCPAPDCYGQNVENVFFEGTEPPKGRYLVEVKLADLKGAPSPVRVRFGARVGSRSYGADLTLSQADDRKGFTFEL